MHCIAEDMLPINTVKNEGLKWFINLIDPRYVLPGRKHFSHIALPKLYAECMEKVEEQLKTYFMYVATTTDLWSSHTSEP